MSEQLIGYLAFGGGVLVMAVVVFVKANLVVCEPNEVVIFSGRTYTREDGRRVGYRVMRGGRRLKIPFVETVSRMSLSTHPIDLKVRGALTAGVIPVDVRGKANVKIAGTEEAGLENAIERFLGKPSRVIGETAREILEGTIREVVAAMLPEEANRDRMAFAGEVAGEARADLSRMGIVLDTLKIQEITDEKGYLEAIARKKNAEVHRDARIAEARSDAAASREESEAKREAEIAEIDARRSVREREKSLRIEEAGWDAEVNREEERASVAGEIARTIEQRSLEEERVEANRLKYEAEVVVPARAEQEAAELEAAGRAAAISENGKAQAHALRLLREQWEDPESRDLFMIHLLPDIVDRVADVVASNLDVERMTVIDGGNGGGIPSLVGSLAGSVHEFLEQVETLTGQDVLESVTRRFETDGEGA